MDWRETMQRMLVRMEEAGQWPAVCEEARAVLEAENEPSREPAAYLWGGCLWRTDEMERGRPGAAELYRAQTPITGEQREWIVRGDELDNLRAQLADAQRDAERLDWIIEHRAYVVSDPECCDGYWLNYARPDGTVWTQATEHETPRAAIDAARGERNA